jgi:hypothetical protein
MLAERFTAQLLAGEPARDPVAVAERLLAVQGQDPRGVRLAIRSRTAGLSAADVDRALSEQRTLVITWLNRGTLHLVRSEDYPWLHALTAPRMLTANARRLAQEGVSPADAERAVKAIERSLAEEGPLTRRQLRERIAVAGVRTEGQAPPFVASPCADRWSPVSMPSRSCATGFADSDPPAQSIASAPWQSSPVATCLATLRLTSATSQSGRGCPCATFARGWAGSPPA